MDITARKRVEAQLVHQSRIAEIFLSVPDDEIYDEIIRLVRDIMHSPLGLFGFIDEEGALEVPSMTREVWQMCQMPQKMSRFPRETWGQSSWGRALMEKKTVYSNEPSTSIPHGHINIRRHISIPILYRREALGLIVVANKETDYSEDDVRALEDIASYVAPILSARMHRARAEATRDFLASIVESSGDAILGVRFDGVIRSCNAGAEKLYGYKSSEVLGQPGLPLIPPERRKEVEEFIERVKQGEVIEPHESVRVAKGGGRIDVSVALSPLRSANGEVVGVSVVARDITAHKRAEQDLLFKTALLEAQSETTIDGILVVDLAGQVLLANRQFARMWGFPEETIRTKDDGELIEHVRGQVMAPEPFMERVRDLYSHPTEESRDEIELKNGRE
jgi:PAS domain S-box-containing protein